MSEGVQLNFDNVFFFFYLVDEDEGVGQIPLIPGVTDYGPTINTGLVALRFSRASGPVLLRNPIALSFFTAGMGSGPPCPLPHLWICACCG